MGCPALVLILSLNVSKDTLDRNAFLLLVSIISFFQSLPQYPYKWRKLVHCWWLMTLALIYLYLKFQSGKVTFLTPYHKISLRGWTLQYLNKGQRAATLKRCVNQNSPTTLKAFWPSEWCSSIPGTFPGGAFWSSVVSIEKNCPPQRARLSSSVLLPHHPVISPVDVISPPPAEKSLFLLPESSKSLAEPCWS